MAPLQPVPLRPPVSVFPTASLKVAVRIGVDGHAPVKPELPITLETRVLPAQPCITCHRNFFPLGYALENFDPIGRWRTHDQAGPVYASGSFVDGTSTNGVVELRKVLLQRPDAFRTTITEKLLLYSAAHSAGILHRDIKPGNVMVTDEWHVKVLDFGIAKLADSGQTEATALTETGAVVGTVAYMSPEQTRGEALDGRSDIFSLGCLLYNAATGQLPFRGPNSLSIPTPSLPCIGGAYSFFTSGIMRSR